jgi:hypothetical protein
MLGAREEKKGKAVFFKPKGSPDNGMKVGTELASNRSAAY